MIQKHACHIITDLSIDSVTVFVNAIMYYKVQDAIKVINNVYDYARSDRVKIASKM